MVITIAYQLIRKKKLTRKHWIHNICKKRTEQGLDENLMKELQGDEERFEQYFRPTVYL